MKRSRKTGQLLDRKADDKKFKGVRREKALRNKTAKPKTAAFRRLP
jgi:hypothetical protein